MWRYCIPLLGSVIFQQLYNIADSLVAGKYVGKNALAAVGNSYEITLIYMAFAFGCNMGCSVIAAQFFGAKNYRKMKTTVYTTFIYSAVLCLILTLTGLFAGGALLHLIHTPADIFADSKLYLDVYTGGLVFLFFYNIATGIFSALGDSKTPFIFLAFSSVSNVFVDILFVKSFHMGVAGVAWATFICQGVSCILSVIVVLLRLRKIKDEHEGHQKVQVFSGEIFSKMLKIAIPSTLQQGFVSIGNIIIQSIINSFGSDVIAGYAAAVKLNNMVITTFTMLGNGVSNFAAQNLGAQKIERISQGCKAALKLIFLTCVPVVILYLMCSGSLVQLFMDENSIEAKKVGVEFLHILAPFYFVVSLLLTGVCMISAAIILYRNLALLTNETTDDLRIGTLRVTTLINIGFLIIGILVACLTALDVITFSENGEKIFAMAFISCIMLASGILCPRIPYNRYTGLRLPWTIRDEETWKIAHNILGHISLPIVLLYVACTLTVPDFGLVTSGAMILWIGIPGGISGVYYLRKYHGHLG